jgi:hypothetical protein
MGTSYESNYGWFLEIRRKLWLRCSYAADLRTRIALSHINGAAGKAQL